MPTATMCRSCLGVQRTSSTRPQDPSTSPAMPNRKKMISPKDHDPCEFSQSKKRGGTIHSEASGLRRNRYSAIRSNTKKRYPQSAVLGPKETVERNVAK